MALGEYLSKYGYGGGAVGTSPSEYLGLRGAQRYGGFLQGEMQAGYLSGASVNPAIRSLVEGGAAGERERRTQLQQGLAAQGVNPVMAAQMGVQGEADYSAGLTSQIAGFEDQLQQRRYGAGENLVGIQNQEEAELTNRAESLRRYEEQQAAARKASKWNKIMGIAGLGVSIFGGPIGGAIMGGLKNAFAPKPEPGMALGDMGTMFDYNNPANMEMTTRMNQDAFNSQGAWFNSPQTPQWGVGQGQSQVPAYQSYGGGAPSMGPMQLGGGMPWQAQPYQQQYGGPGFPQTPWSN